jgi:hypothetical protein
MNTQTIFGHKIFLSKCPDESIYKNKTLEDSIEMVYRIPDIKDKVDRSQIGEALTSVGIDLHIAKLPGMERLMEWLGSQLQLVADAKGITKPRYIMPRAWTNRMFKDCEGRCHTHPREADGVAIFYYQAPKNSANLVLIDGGTSGSEYHDYPGNKKHFIVPSEGQLIIHPPEVPHAVSRHNSDDPRTCFIFEFVFID